jgi:hypothetical protein
VSNNAHRSQSIKKVVNKTQFFKKIELAIGETLSKAQFANEKLAWGDGDFEDQIFYTPLRSP